MRENDSLVTLPAPSTPDSSSRPVSQEKTLTRDLGHLRPPKQPSSVLAPEKNPNPRAFPPVERVNTSKCTATMLSNDNSEPRSAPAADCSDHWLVYAQPIVQPAAKGSWTPFASGEAGGLEEMRRTAPLGIRKVRRAIVGVTYRASQWSKSTLGNTRPGHPLRQSKKKKKSQSSSSHKPPNPRSLFTAVSRPSPRQDPIPPLSSSHDPNRPTHSWL